MNSKFSIILNFSKKCNLLSINTQFPVNFLLSPSTPQGKKENSILHYQNNHHSVGGSLNECFCGVWEFYQLRIKDKQTHISTLLPFLPNSQIYSSITINTPINKNYVCFVAETVSCPFFLGNKIPALYLSPPGEQGQINLRNSFCYFTA